MFSEVSIGELRYFEKKNNTIIPIGLRHIYIIEWNILAYVQLMQISLVITQYNAL